MLDVLKLGLEILGGHIIFRAIIVPFIARFISDETKKLYHKAKGHFLGHDGSLADCKNGVCAV